MYCHSGFFTHWSSNDNYLTSDFIIDYFINLVNNEPLWEKDQLCYEIYKKDVNKIQKRCKVTSLDYKDEQTLIELKCNGDSEVFKKLIYSQMPYVIYIAKKYQNFGLPLNDLISEGNLGLIEAIKRIEPRGFRVSSYATSFISGYIRDAIDKYGTQIHHPVNIHQNIRKLQKAIDKLESQNAVQPSYEEIAEVVNIDIESVANIMSYINSEVSIEQLSAYFGDSFIFDDYINSACNPHFNFSNEAIDEELYGESLEIEIDSSCRGLSDREYKILKMFFGIGCKKKELEEIATQFDLTRERVRQIKEKAIRRLKGQKSKKLREYLG